MKVQIKHRYRFDVLFEADCTSLGACVLLAVASGAYLEGANLEGANLEGANLYGANLEGAKNVPAITQAQTRITPEGTLIGWKKCHGGVIVKLRIPEDARRSNATGRKCRAEWVEVVEVYGAEVGLSLHDGGATVYRPGETVKPDRWEEDRWQECAPGVHFFLTREEAEKY